MKKLILITLLFLFSYNLFSQDLSYYRLEYANRRNLAEFTLLEFKRGSISTAVSMVRETKKLFYIPADIRKQLYPFNKIDSIVIKTQEKNIFFNNAIKLDEVSNILFNYYTSRGFKTTSVTKDCDGNIRQPNVAYCVLFYSSNKEVKYVNYYGGYNYRGKDWTNFSAEEIAEMDITEEKIRLLVEKYKTKK